MSGENNGGAHGGQESPERPFSILVAMTEDRVIGKDGRTPWHIPGDLKVVKKITMGGTVVMGRITWLSIGKPLPGRINIVVSSTMEPVEGITVCRTLEEALKTTLATGRELFCLGGASIYRQLFTYTHRLYISMVPGRYEGDTYFPGFDIRHGDSQARNSLMVSRSSFTT